MRKGVNAALKTKYESKAWKKWFVDTAKRLMEKLDAESVDDNVSDCLRNYLIDGYKRPSRVVLLC